MRSADAYGSLVQLGRPLIETREAAARLGLSLSRTSHLLRSLQEAALVHRVKPGLWALGAEPDPFVVAPYLTAPFPAYISFWSALRRHDMIEQIPRQVFAASLHRTQRIATSFAVYSIHHLAPDVFGGYEGTDEAGYVATPEKALFDTAYLRAPRSGRLYLPELTLPASFDGEALDGWVARIPRPRLRTMVERSLRDVLAGAERDTRPD